MKKIHILMLSLLTVFAFGAVAASVASAAEFELLCVFDEGSLIVPKYGTEATCLAMTPIDEAGAWHLGFEWLANASPIPAAGVTVDITIGGSTKRILLEDMSAGPLKQATAVTCEGTGLGLLLPGGLDEVNSAVPTKCERETDGACTTLIEVKPVNLPWLTELLPFGTGEENEAIDDLYEGTGGNPGWAVKCNTALGEKTDTCTTNKGHTVELALAEEELRSEFQESALEEEWAECSEGNPKLNGLVVGLLDVKALISGVLVAIGIN
jgi:hypothetical protein